MDDSCYLQRLTIGNSIKRLLKKQSKFTINERKKGCQHSCKYMSKHDADKSTSFNVVSAIHQKQNSSLNLIQRLRSFFFVASHIFLVFYGFHSVEFSRDHDTVGLACQNDWFKDNSILIYIIRYRKYNFISIKEKAYWMKNVQKIKIQLNTLLYDFMMTLKNH